MDTPTNEEGNAAPPAPDAAPVRPAKRRFARWLAASFASLVLMAGALVALVGWALHSESGSAWLVTLVPQLQVMAPRGSLIGDFAAERIEIGLPGTGGVLRLDAPRWQALAATGGDHGRWLHLTIAALHVDRITLLRSDPSAPASSEPASPPRTLRLPLEIEIREASVDELRLGANDDAPALRALRARVHLGDAGGALHRLDALATSYDKARATGHLAIAADPPFALDAKLALASADALPPWQAEVAAAGPLEALDVSATARVSPSSAHPAQSLAARALVKPFAAWPLGELRASTSALDLAAFSSAAPATSLSGQATLATSGIDRPAIVSIELRNDRAGRWNEGLLPMRQLRAELRGRPDDRSTLDLQTLVRRARHGAPRRRPRHGARPLDAPIAGRPTSSSTRCGRRRSMRARRRPRSTARPRSSAPASPRRRPRRAPSRSWPTCRARSRTIASRTPRRVSPGCTSTPAPAVARSNCALPKRAWAAPRDALGQLTRTAHERALARRGHGDARRFRPGTLVAGQHRFAAVARRQPPQREERVRPRPARVDARRCLAAARSPTRQGIADPRSTAPWPACPLEGEASFANGDGTAQPKLDLVAAGNHVHVEGQVAAAGSRDHWQATIGAPQLARLSVLVRAPGAAASAPALAGTLTATARVEGRWPDVDEQRRHARRDLRFDTIGVRRAEGRWRLGSAADAPLDGALPLDGVSVSGRQLERVRASVSGTARAHRRRNCGSTPTPCRREWADALAAPRRRTARWRPRHRPGIERPPSRVCNAAGRSALVMTSKAAWSMRARRALPAGRAACAS